VLIVIAGPLRNTHDGVLHLTRLAALHYAVGAGDIWPRYAPELFYGLGAPLFHYYPPLYLYPAEALHLLGLPLVGAYKGGLMAYTVAGALGMLRLGREFGSGVGAAVVFVFAPYVLFNLLWRGAAAEYAALCVLPWVLWAFRRLAVEPVRGRFMAAVALYALFIPLHNITTLTGSAALAVFCLLWGLEHKSVGWLLAAGLGGMALSAFAWAPALADLHMVQLGQSGGNVPIREHFVTLGALFAPPPQTDPTQQGAYIPMAVGWAQVGLAAAAFVVALRSRTHHRTTAASAAIIGGGLLLMLPLSLPVWQGLPLLGFVGFPWRLLGVVTVLCAMMAAPLMKDWPPAAVGIAGLIVGVMGVPWFYSAPGVPFTVPQAVTDIRRFEADTGLLMTMSYGEFIPRWADPLPPSDTLTAQNGRFDRSPRSTAVTDATWQRKRATFTVEGPTDLRLQWVYFPGWQAEAAGQALPVSPADGLLSVAVPEGRHRVTVSYHPTQAARIATAFSVVSVLAVGYGATRLPPRRPAEEPFGWGPLAAAAGIGVLLLALKLGVVDRFNTPLKAERIDELEGVRATVDDTITLLEVSTQREGARFTVDTFWQRQAIVSEDYRFFLSVRDAEGHTIATASSPTSLPPTQWQAELYVRDTITLRLPPGTPPGDYQAVLSVFSPSQQRDLGLRNAAGQPIGAALPLESFTLRREAAIDAPVPSAAVTVVEAESTLPPQAEPGTPFTLSVLWALGQAADYEFSLLWRSTKGEVVQGGQHPLVVGYPASQWQPGDRWRGVHSFFVPAELDSGPYMVAIEVNGQTYPLGEVRVEAPQRMMSMPPAQRETDLRWVGGIRMVGFSQGAQGVTLVWQAAQPQEANYTVFVHAVDEDGTILAQADVLPARPIPGWAAGEFITQMVPLNVPPGAAALRIGLYDAATGERLPLRDGGSFATLPLP
jgi:hypothetical protein